jgi:hypothetical protein
MARKAKKTAVAHARAFRHTKHHPVEPNDAQPRAKQFSSARYKSHRRVPETVARVFDHV